MTTQEPIGEWFGAVPEWRRGQRILAAATGILFVAFCALAPLLWLVARPTRMISNAPPPRWEWSAIQDGSAMRALETHVKETSWVTFHMRGVLNEVLFRIGLLENDQVTIGRDGWLYFAETLLWKPMELAATREKRRAVLRQAMEATAANDVRLLVVPVPDRVTIHPEHLPPLRPADPGRVGLYDEILADLSAVGVPHVDVRSAFLAHKAAHPDDELYFRRDTHWNLSGQLLTADLVKNEIAKRGWAPLVPACPDIVVEQTMRRPMVPGLVAMLGLRLEVDVPDDRGSAFLRGLFEDWTWRPIGIRDPSGRVGPIPMEQDDAKVALCGTSFSESFGLQLIGTLGARVDRRGVSSTGRSFGGFRAVLRSLGKNGFTPRILVWEFVQREYQADWLEVGSLRD